MSGYDDRLAGYGVRPRAAGGRLHVKTDRDVVTIPDDDRRKILHALQAAGIKPTEDAVHILHVVFEKLREPSR